MRPAKLLWATIVVRFPLVFFVFCCCCFFFLQRRLPQTTVFPDRKSFFFFFLVIFVLLFVPFALEKGLLSEFKFSQLFCDDTE